MQFDGRILTYIGPDTTCQTAVHLKIPGHRRPLQDVVSGGKWKQQN